VSLGTPADAQLGDGAGLGQILDASSIIDLTLPGRYFADATGGPGADDFIIIANPNSVSLPVVLTFVKPSGAWVRRTFTLGAKNRTALHLAGEPGVGGQGEVSVAVQSADPNYPVAADHAVYWGTNWAAGRSTMVRAGPSYRTGGRPCASRMRPVESVR